MVPQTARVAFEGVLERVSDQPQFSLNHGAPSTRVLRILIHTGRLDTVNSNQKPTVSHIHELFECIVAALTALEKIQPCESEE